jgi:predicted outer membrane repeat protein
MYYYRIYCENRAGAALGEEIFFTTKSSVNPDVNGILYAKPDGTGDGSSWVNALHGNDLQLGIDHADVKQIWLAKGKYVPTSFPNGGTIERQKHFMLRHDKVIYGGFNGTETAVEQRDIKINKTILSGDIGAESEFLDNTFRVLNNGSSDIDSTAVIDGVTISDANGDGSNGSGKGGGMLNRNSCSPTIRNCTFENNRALYGGGIYNIAAFPRLENCVIINNTALIAGGGLFYRNKYDFKENTDVLDRTIELYHCTVAGNSAPQGSQITFAQESRSDNNYIKIYNSIVWGADPEIYWCNIDNYHQMEETQRPSGSDIAFSGLSYPESGEGNFIISRNNTGDPNSPYFTDPANNDYSLQSNSACKDKAIYRYKTDTDILGTARPQGAAYDMGAYEFVTDDPVGLPPEISTSYTDSIGIGTAMFHTDVISNGGIPLCRRGVKVSDIENFDPEIQGKLHWVEGDFTGSEFDTFVTGLEPDKTYFYCSYAENRIGYDYGEQSSFKTIPIIPDGNGVIYVKTGGKGNGSSWVDALGGESLQSAIDSAKPGQKIWVAKGVYKPNSWPVAKFWPNWFKDPPVEREKHFSLRDSVEVYGGFAGTETSTEERNIFENETILTGDIGIKGDVSDNCLSVIINNNSNYSSDTPEPIFHIDGFTITGGYNDNNRGWDYLDNGGGMRNLWGVIPIIKNCRFIGNTAIEGGAIYFEGYHSTLEQKSKSTIEYCVFESNKATAGRGGAIFVNDATIFIDILACRFVNNSSLSHGGAVHLYGAMPKIFNCLFDGNTTDSWGSALYSEFGGAWFVLDLPLIINNTFVNNQITSETAKLVIYLDNYYNYMANNAVWGNDGSRIWLRGHKSYFYNNAVTEEAEYVTEGGNNIVLSANNAGDPNSPYFSDPERGHWWLQEASPLKDTGLWTDEVPLYDIMGNPRDAVPDIGCYEFDPTSIEDDGTALPRTAELYQNYPNPFNPATNIRFALSRPGHVELNVYNVLGQFVKKLADKDFVAGYHSVRFEADDLNSGVYYYRLKAEGKELTKKMLLVK